MQVPLRERCVSEALKIIAESGLPNLSLREVARRLSVSHQAPYKHFSSREHLLAVSIGRSYEALGKSIEERVRAVNPAEDLRAIGEAYLRFARENPIQYRLLFELPEPELAVYEDSEAKMAVAFEILLGVVTRLTGVDDLALNRECSMFAWATVHGLASLTANQVFPAIGLFDKEAQEAAVSANLSMICLTIQARAEMHRRTDKPMATQSVTSR